MTRAVSSRAARATRATFRAASPPGEPHRPDAELSCSGQIFGQIIDERDLRGGQADPVDQFMVDHRIWFAHSDFRRVDHHVEEFERKCRSPAGLGDVVGQQRGLTPRAHLRDQVEHQWVQLFAASGGRRESADVQPDPAALLGVDADELEELPRRDLRGLQQRHLGVAAEVSDQHVGGQAQAHSVLLSPPKEVWVNTPPMSNATAPTPCPGPPASGLPLPLVIELSYNVLFWRGARALRWPTTEVVARSAVDRRHASDIGRRSSGRAADAVVRSTAGQVR